MEDFVLFREVLFIDTEILLKLGSIALIDLVLSGDNAIVIALASRSLSDSHRKKAILIGSAGAIILRVLLTFIAAYLLTIPYLKFVGGIALLYIAVKVLDIKPPQVGSGFKNADGLLAAVKIILIADVIMSLDNVLAIAAVSDGNVFLLVMGLLLSIPLIMGSSKLLMDIMDRFSIIVYIGAAILAWTAAGMILSEGFVLNIVEGYDFAIQVAITVITILIGYIIRKKSFVIIK